MEENDVFEEPRNHITPKGGVYSIAMNYEKETFRPCLKSKAGVIVISEYDENDICLARTYGYMKNRVNGD